MTKGSILQEDTSILNTYAHNNIVLDIKYNEKIDKSLL
jgi:hypothetical protein